MQAYCFPHTMNDFEPSIPTWEEIDRMQKKAFAELDAALARLQKSIDELNKELKKAIASMEVSKRLLEDAIAEKRRPGAFDWISLADIKKDDENAACELTDEELDKADFELDTERDLEGMYGERN